MIKNKNSVTFASFDKSVHKPEYFPIHHSKGGTIMFLSMGHKIGLPQFLCILLVLSMLSKYFKGSEIQHDIP